MVENLGLSPFEIRQELIRELEKGGLNKNDFNAIVDSLAMVIASNNEKILHQLREHGLPV